MEQGESIIIDEVCSDCNIQQLVFNEVIENQELTYKINSISLSQFKLSNIIKSQLYHSNYTDYMFVLLNNESNINLVSYDLRFTKKNNTLACDIQLRNQQIIENSSNCMDFTFFNQTIYVLCFVELEKSLKLIKIVNNTQSIIILSKSQDITHKCTHTIENVGSEIFLFSCFNTSDWEIQKISFENSQFTLNHFMSDSDTTVKYRTYINYIYLFTTNTVYQYIFTADNFTLEKQEQQNGIIDLQINSDGSYVIITQSFFNEIAQMGYQENQKLLYHSSERHYNILFNSSIIINNQYFKYIDQIDQISYVDKYKLLIITNKDTLELHQFNYYKGLIKKGPRQILLNSTITEKNNIVIAEPIKSLSHFIYRNVEKFGENEFKINMYDFAIFDMEVEISLQNLNTSISYQIQEVPLIKIQETFEWEVLLTTHSLYQSQVKLEWILCQQGELILTQINIKTENVEQKVILSHSCALNDQIFYYKQKQQLVLLIYNAQNNYLHLFLIEQQYQFTDNLFKLDGNKIQHIDYLNTNNLLILYTEDNIFQLDLVSKNVEKIEQSVISQYRFIDRLDYFSYSGLNIYIYRIQQYGYLNSLIFDANIYKKIEDILIFQMTNFLFILITKTDQIELLHYKLSSDYQFIFLKKLPTYHYQIIFPLIIKREGNNEFTLEALDKNQTVILLYSIQTCYAQTLTQSFRKASSNYFITYSGLVFVFDTKILMTNKKCLVINERIDAFNNQPILIEELTTKLNDYNAILKLKIVYFDYTTPFKQLRQSVNFMRKSTKLNYELNLTEIVQGRIKKIESVDFQITPPLQLLKSNVSVKSGEIMQFYGQTYFINQDSKIYKIMNNFELNPIAIDYDLLQIDSTYQGQAIITIDSKKYIVLVYRTQDKILFLLMDQIQQDNLQVIQLIEVQQIIDESCLIKSVKNKIIIINNFLNIYNFFKINHKIEVDFFEIDLPSKCESFEINQVGLYYIQKNLIKKTIEINEFSFERRQFELLMIVSLDSDLKLGQSKIIELSSNSIIIAFKFHNMIDIIQYIPSYNKIATLMANSLNIYFDSISLIDIDQKKKAIIYPQYNNNEYHCIVYTFDINENNLIYPIQFIENCNYQFIFKMSNHQNVLIEQLGKLQNLSFYKIYKNYQVNINKKIDQSSISIINFEEQEIKIIVKIVDNQSIYSIIIIFHLALYLVFAYFNKKQYKIVREQ